MSRTKCGDPTSIGFTGQGTDRPAEYTHRGSPRYDITPRPLSSYPCFVFDLDGTLWLDEHVLTGAHQLFRSLTRHGHKILVYTNNTRHSHNEVHSKLQRLGLGLAANCIYTGSSLLGRALNRYGIQETFVVGTSSLKCEIQRSGVLVLDDPKVPIDVLTIGLETGFDDSSLANIVRIANQDTLIFCGNRDRDFPTSTGPKIGSGRIVAQIESALGSRHITVIGKPSVFGIQALAQDHHLQPRDIMFIGDNYDSDIAMAKEYGCDSLFVAPPTPGRTPLPTTTLIAIIERLEHSHEST